MNELLLTLAEEIRQTLVWLGQEEEPSESSIRFRLRTLREAAAMSRMNAVEAVLANLETKLTRLTEPSGPAKSEQTTEPSGLEEVLGRLSSLIVSLAEPAEAQELEWVMKVGQVESDLEHLVEELGQGAERLGQLTLMSDRAVTAETDQHRTELMVELGREMRREVERIKSQRRKVEATADLLRRATRMLARELSATHRIPLDPTFARLRERVRRWGRTHAKPVSLQCRSTRLEVGIRQYEPLVRVLDSLLDHMLEAGLSGLGNPQQRKEAGKATVASIVVEGNREGSLLELRFEDDGEPDRPDPHLDKQIRSDLRRLRARLWRDGQVQEGQRLVLQLPIWYSSLEALPVMTSVGEVLVPLAVVDQILGAGRQEQSDLPVIELERRTRPKAPADPDRGLVCALGSWRGLLPGRVNGPVVRVVARPAPATDPPWVIGRVIDEGQDRPLLHPLPFTTTSAGWKCLFPKEA